jgi:hypothetical protein
VEAALDLGLQVAPGDEDRVRHRALLELVGLPHVEEHRAVGTELLGRRGVHLADVLLGRVEEISEVAHRLVASGLRIDRGEMLPTRSTIR